MTTQGLHRLGRTVSRAAILAVLAMAATAAQAKTEQYSVITNGARLGGITVESEPSGDGVSVSIDYDFKNNGRGPTMKEELLLDAAGLPVKWVLTGNSTFGNAIDERFEQSSGTARWTDSTGSGSDEPMAPVMYVAQEGSPWALGLYARALLADDDRSMAVAPGGTLSLTELETMTVQGDAGPVEATAYALSGIDLAPDYFMLDGEGEFFAYISPRFVIVREGYEKAELPLSDLATRLSTQRFVDIQSRAAHDFGMPVRITNVRLFDPAKESLTDPVTVLVYRNRIAAIEPVDSPVTMGEMVIDGEGGTLVPGMYEMHGHISQEGALLNLLAGVTSVRDMGNENDVLDGLIERIDDGILAGPRITRSGFIEGKSPFNSNNGMLVSSQAEAIDAARWYAARGFNQIKIYNSMNPDWVPALVEEAHLLGLRVAGHVPAFTNADAMIAAGYDELTHINQVMLGWVLEPDEDTRTLLRLTALQRLPQLELNSPRVQKTIDAMVKNGVAIDPTLAIHEVLTLSRNGELAIGTVDYIENMPVGVQRSARQAFSKIDSPEVDAAYRGAFDQIIATVKMMHDRGIFIVPGTDMGGSFVFHRELELYQRAGFTAAGILRRATLDMADYLGEGESLGSIEKGKLADFFLIPGNPVENLKAIKTIRMVVKDGVFYFPAEVYPEFGIKPFIDAPPARVVDAAR